MRILVVDNNVELCQILREFFNSQEDLSVVGEAHDGEQALRMIQELEPDVVILDVTMPHLDGIGVLERLDSLGLKRRPRIIVLTAFGRDDLIARFTELGVDYFMLKPFSLEVLADRVRQFTQARITIGQAETAAVSVHANSGVNINAHLTRLLHKLGVPPHYKGFSYLRDAVLMCADEGYLGGGLTKELYPALAEKYATTPGGVEAAIRNAIVAAWETGNRDAIIELCGPHAAERVPTNSLFIAKLTEEIHVAQQ